MAIESKASFKGYNVFIRPDFPQGSLGVGVRSCLPPAFPGFPGRLTGLFQGLLSRGCNLRNHTEWSPTQGCLCKFPLAI